MLRRDIGWRQRSAYRRNHEEVGFVALVRVELELSRAESDFAEPVLHDVGRQQEREAQDDALVPPTRRRRHQQLSFDQLVARGEALSFVHETIDFRSGPSSRTEDWHRHNLLGARIEAQLGTVYHRAGAGPLHHQPVAGASNSPRAGGPGRQGCPVGIGGVRRVASVFGEGPSKFDDHRQDD